MPVNTKYTNSTKSTPLKKVRSLGLFNTELSPVRYWLGLRSQEVGVGKGVGRTILYATLSPPK